MKRIFLLVTAIWAGAGLARAQEARLPYHQVYKIQKAVEAINASHTNLVAEVSVNSIVPEVTSADLKVRIASTNGDIPVVIKKGGQFSIPMRDDLLKEDPWIITNQRRGTMRLNWQFGLQPGRMAPVMEYRSLMSPVRDCQQVEEEMRAYFPESPRQTIAGLKLDFPSVTNATVTIHLTAGDRVLSAPPRGDMVLLLRDEWLRENPKISFSDLPEIVELDSHASTP